MRYISLLVIVVIFCGVARAETARLPVTADVGICAHPNEASLNTGARSVVRVKGNEHYYLFAFDTEPVGNWKIQSAVLHVKLAAGNLRRMAFCTVPCGWVEGTANSDIQDGSTCFTHVKYPTATWPLGGAVEPPTGEQARTGGTMLDATFNSPFMRWQAADVKAGQDAWLEIPIDPDLIYACAIGLSHGLVMSEEKGQTRENHDIYTRERAGAQPYLTVEGQPLTSGQTPPRQPKLDATAWPQAAGATGTVVPKMPAPPAAAMMPRIYTQNGWTAEVYPATVAVAPDAKPSLGKDAAMPVPITARNAWAAVQVMIFPPGGKAKGLGMQASGLRFAGTQLETPPGLRTQVHRVWCVKDAKGVWHGEALVPLAADSQFCVPWKENAVPNQQGQALLVDVWVPKNAAVGPYEGKLEIQQQGRGVLTVPLRLEVGAAVLGDEFRIVGDMNTYDSPAGAMGVSEKDPQAYMEMERKYYRLAHAHRMTLNVLPYSQSGQVHWRGAPTLAGQGKELRIGDWSQWDERFGPLLTGEAFTAAQGYLGPGEGMPLHHMYLPFHENWPCPLADYFKPWPPPKDFQQFLQWSAELPPIEKCLGATTDAYVRNWQVILKDSCLHLSKLNRGRTRFQIYLNDKYNFRERGHGISLWLLDEPMAPDDFLALRYFGSIARPCIDLARRWEIPQMLVDFRVDLSRPTHQRQWLDGLVDLNVCPDQLYQQRRHMAYRREKFGEQYWNYRMPPSYTGDNTPWAVWPVRSLCWGAVGTLPWQTIASDGDLAEADETALMYPGRKFGLDTPLPSLRMKAWRQGLQDAELLRMLQATRGWNDQQLRAFVGAACGLDGWEDGLDPAAGAPIVTFGGLDAEKLDRLRRATLAALEGK